LQNGAFHQIGNSFVTSHMRKLIDSTIGRLRLIGFAEGTSLLVLLGIAMPLTYCTGNPAPVKVCGWTHGILFILYIYQAYTAKEEYNWTYKSFFYALLAAFFPFGTFIFDTWLKKQKG
jgi:integral membrane protein